MDHGPHTNRKKNKRNTGAEPLGKCPTRLSVQGKRQGWGGEPPSRREGHTHTHTLTHTLTHSLSHTHTHTHSLTHSHTHSLSVSHTHTHTHTPCLVMAAVADPPGNAVPKDFVVLGPAPGRARVAEDPVAHAARVLEASRERLPAPVARVRLAHLQGTGGRRFCT